ncbi:hypothetical protein D9756_005158 [Leucocoprinus leucothites]|uniref:Glutaminase A central domain-containing protein n=1 Tax=Leucocoprinus leucothites TaxID=201217 RepID=A0A8H5G9D3_9AGAR|nr:hypothetical protein D9756_005158 [Leucoagaricus leucothites]
MPQLLFKDHATALLQTWTQRAVTQTHIKSTFDQEDSWGLVYNLFPDIWLDMKAISNDILTRQADLYKIQSGVQATLSLQSSRGNTIYPHWNLLTAATIPNNMSPSSSRHTRNIGAIVGGVIGGITGVIIIALALWYLRRRLMQEYDSELEGQYVQPRPFSLVLSSSLDVAPEPANMVSRTEGGPLTRLAQLSQIPPISTNGREALGRGAASPIRDISSALDVTSANATDNIRAEDIRAEVAQLRRELERMRDREDPRSQYT